MRNMGCSRQSLIKLAPVNGVIVFELGFVSEMVIFSELELVQVRYMLSPFRLSSVCL